MFFNQFLGFPINSLGIVDRGRLYLELLMFFIFQMILTNVSNIFEKSSYRQTSQILKKRLSEPKISELALLLFVHGGPLGNSHPRKFSRPRLPDYIPQQMKAHGQRSAGARSHQISVLSFEEAEFC